MLAAAIVILTFPHNTLFCPENVVCLLRLSHIFIWTPVRFTLKANTMSTEQSGLGAYCTCCNIGCQSM